MALQIIQGENETLTLHCRDVDDNPIDLTGKTIIAKLKLSGTETNLNCSISGNAILGAVTLALTDVQTAQLKVGDLPIALFVGTYAAPPVITPATDSTDSIFQFTGKYSVVKVVT